MLLNSLIIAFSMYSKIPMPRVEWNDKNMRYSMCFFPFVGLVTGAAVYIWCIITKVLGLNEIITTSGYVLIPLLITGGIHLDGFIDTKDALNSYKSREEKLLILKDSHIGAFALISTVIYILFSLGVWSALYKGTVLVLCIGFVLSRALSGFSVVTFNIAKDSGLAHAFSDAADKLAVRNVLIVLILLSAGTMTMLGGIAGIFSVIGAVSTFIYYRNMSYKQFGGITGDLAGWFLQTCELNMAISALIGQLIQWRLGIWF